MELKSFMEQTRLKVDAALERMLPAGNGFGGRLGEAMRYCVFSGGKRLRPFLCLTVCESLGGAEEEAMPSACALEMVHTYSLVHDDLPAMDDDDLRRGRASCHKAFDEATAILAGDALLTLAFEVVARHTPSPDLVAPLVTALGRAAGPEGMVLGQVRDLETEGAAPDLGKVEAIHETKTAAMIRAAFLMGAVAARAGGEMQERMACAGNWIGRAFQAIDDVLDIEGSSEELGKTAGKDREAGKMTFPAAVGLEASKRAAREMTGKAMDLLEGPEPFERIRELAEYMLHRTN